MTYFDGTMVMTDGFIDVNSDAFITFKDQSSDTTLSTIGTSSSGNFEISSTKDLVLSSSTGYIDIQSDTYTKNMTIQGIMNLTSTTFYYDSTNSVHISGSTNNVTIANMVVKNLLFDSFRLSSLTQADIGKRLRYFFSFSILSFFLLRRIYYNSSFSSKYSWDSRIFR